MARNRNTTEQNENKENTLSEGMFTPVEDTDLLAQILATSHGRGDYKAVMSAVIESGHRLVEIPLDRGIFQGRKDTTVKSGFENVKTSKEPPEGADKVKVVKKDGAIYLVNQAVTG